MAQRTEAIDYARTKFSSLGPRFDVEVKRLMTALVYWNRLATSPYADLAAPSLLYAAVFEHVVSSW